MIEDHLAELRKLQDPKRWPVKDDEYIILDGEIYSFIESGNPFEEQIYKPLYR